MTDYETVTLERHGPVAVLTMNRPAALNSFNGALRRDILLAARAVNADDSIRAIVLTGAGRAFGAGADLTELPQAEGGVVWVEDQLNHEFKPAILEIFNAPKPWISAVEGAAAGISSAFAMVCDLTVMAEEAYIYQAFTAIGLVPDGGATWHLVRTVGRKRAYEIIVSGEKLNAQKCHDLGLCNRVVPAGNALQESLAWARQLSEKAPLSMRYAKQALNAAIERDLDATISDEALLQHKCINSDDSREGVTAFIEKRAPQWTGS